MLSIPGLLLPICSSLSMAEAPLPAPPVTPYQITGVVVNSLTGTPVPRSHLTPSLAQQNRGPKRQFPSSDGVDADERGRFSIALPSAGAWDLTVSAPGYVSEAYDQHDNYSSAIVLTATAPAMEIVFRLPPEASIRGLVLDEAGEAVRNARVGLLSREVQGPGQSAEQFRFRNSTQTDDRGAYEFANLIPGKYRVLVDAKPWYAASTQARRSGSSTTVESAQPLDPSLDVTYQQTWFPGVDDQAQAETIALRAGDDRRADFHLVPIPAIHLRIVPPSTEQNGNRSFQAFPALERVDTGGMGFGFAQSAVTNLPQGQVDVGGLAPGLYRVRIPQQNSEPRTALVEVTAGSARVLDMNAATVAVANVTVRLDGADSDERPFGVELIEAETGQHFPPLGGGRPFPPNARRGPPMRQAREISFQVPPGRYEVTLFGRGEAYLTGISAQGAETSGRFVTLHDGEATLTLHTTSGRATVVGTAKTNGKPSVGAMVLLVPAGLDDPASLTAVVRDQTNTDGSFDLLNVIPGQYILIAIDHGWNVNWTDPSTLRGYLMQGIPLDIRGAANIKQDVDAQAP
jgi:uncharacterized GH25 family protein